MHRKHTWITWERAPWAGVSGTSSWIAPGAPLAWRKWSLSRTITVGLVLAKFVPLFFKKKMCAFFILISFQTTGVRSLATRRSLASDFSQFYSMCSSCGSTIFYTGKKKMGFPFHFSLFYCRFVSLAEIVCLTKSSSTMRKSETRKTQILWPVG